MEAINPLNHYYNLYYLGRLSENINKIRITVLLFLKIKLHNGANRQQMTQWTLCSNIEPQASMAICIKLMSSTLYVVIIHLRGCKHIFHFFMQRFVFVESHRTVWDTFAMWIALQRYVKWCLFRKGTMLFVSQTTSQVTICESLRFAKEVVDLNKSQTTSQVTICEGLCLQKWS